MSVNWEYRKNKWVEYVKKFYNDAEVWSGSLSDIKINYDTILLQEKDHGTFNVDKMTIAIGKKTVILEPVVTVMIGVRGSLEMRGRNGVIKFVLVPEELQKPGIMDNIAYDKSRDSNEFPSLVWKIATKEPNVKFIVINKEIFNDTLMKIL